MAVAGVFEQHEIAALLALPDFAQPQEPPHAVLDVHHVVARFQVGEVGRERGQVRARAGGPRQQIRGAEQIVAAE